MRKIVPGVYMVKDKTNGKVYIGQSKDIMKRFRQYYWAATTNTQSYIETTRFIVVAMRNKGIENFEFSILASGDKYSDPNIRLETEARYIRKYNADDPEYGYNESSGGEIGLTVPRSQSFIERLNRAIPVFLYDINTKGAWLFYFGAKAIADKFNCDKAITSHALNRGDVFSKHYYIIPARSSDRDKVLNKRCNKLHVSLQQKNIRNRTITRVNNSYNNYLFAVSVINDISKQYGFD